MLQLERNRKYIDKRHETTELTKRFLILFPLFLSAFVCQHYSRPTSFANPIDIAIQLTSGIIITSVDFTPFPNILLSVLSLLALYFNMNSVFISIHEYFIYGICWVVANKTLDYEDAQKLFPGLALLQNTSYYISIWINNRYLLAIPYAIIIGYRVFMHSWKHPEEVVNISKQTKVWWFCIMLVMTVSYACCFTMNTDMGILKLDNTDDNFEIFRYFKLDYMSIKGIATFILFLIINTSIFMNVRWRFIGFLNALFICIIQGLLIAFPKINNYNRIIDTLSIGLYSYLFSPMRATVYSVIDYGFVWNQIPINVIINPLIVSGMRFFTYFHIFIFPVFFISYLYSVFIINNEFKELLL